MAVIVQQTIVDTGLEATYAAATETGDTFANDGSERQFLHVKNGNVGDIAVTVPAAVATTDKPSFPTLTVPDIEVTVTASEERMIGPFPLTAYGAIPDVTYDVHEDVTVALIKI